mmetsp:Transcript_15563/g.33709  ORF Transcript_15563/g.33709 Transcript_15563/m.33709 type:complete len:791 (-) Transcript_15563:849-3221(-)|eukprot:CAMPEP_0172303302 /NCGR_PEP_ID=MMETSP1058-20130122/4845_1 /TAXON_ID=83371 /ORGANISM="Detonula confervacea, Strain CCMP 353" /LENGTH=790 /DNA_ID=CAMNT_0013014051 /DNA_START=43 /DNA_END=2415 /DNA_ORIENTATION=+
MTTLSTHSRLSSSLVQTKGRCSDLSHSHGLEHEIGATRTSADNGDGGDGDVGTCNDNGDLVFEDEDIASVEADGTSGIDVPDDGGTVEKQLLTAALVTSIVELAGTPQCGGSRKNTGDTSGTKDVCAETRRISLMESQALDATNKREGIADQVTFPHVNVTPPASASSSFSSVDSIPESLKKTPDLNQSYTVGRTIYKRASKSAASQKVAFVLAPPCKTNNKALKVPHPGTKKRKLNSNGAGIVKFPTMLELAVETSPSVNPVSKSSVPMSWSSTTEGSMLCQQPVHSNESTCSTFAAKDNEVSTDSMHQPEKKYSQTLTAHAKSVQGRSNPSPPSMNKRGSKLNPSLVPNPLAGMQDSSFNVHPLMFPALSSKSKGFTTNTNTLMSAAPDAFVPGSNPPSRNVSTMHLGGQLADIAESMSSQHFQTDVLAVSSASEVVPPGRGRIFSIDLDPAVLDFVENVVDPLATTNESQGSCDDTCGAKNPNVTFRGGFEYNSGRMPFRRDRGFSFEFFSFGINEDEPLPPVPATICGSHISLGNRQRGDSIIFDPTSFREGGIHETSALLHIKQENEGQNIEVIPSAPVSHIASCMAHHNLTQGSSPTTSTLYPLLSMKGYVPDSKTASEASVSFVHGKPSFHPKPCAKVKFIPPSAYAKLPKAGPSSLSEVVATASSRTIPQAFSDNTIHMPHGSDAAAAAAAGMPKTSPTTPHDGFSLSHTACPMELLNKGGRIGIYLPEERKARIAKFHSKRKIRIWRKRIKYDCRKKLADSRPRIKGRFVKRSDVDGEASL